MTSSKESFGESTSIARLSILYSYKPPREGAEKGVNLLSVRYGTLGLCTGSKRSEAFSEAFSHSKLLSTKNETPGKFLVLKLIILSQLPDSERKAVLSTTLWRVVGVVPGGAHKSTGGWCEGSNPPHGVPGDHSCENVLAV